MCKKNLDPVFVSDGGDDAEAVTINILVKNMAISITSAYGPQESAKSETKWLFWNHLNDEAKKLNPMAKDMFYKEI